MQNIYERITSQILNQLERGIVPWKSPYFSTIGFPRNFSTGKHYQGVNILLLGCQRFTSPDFLTYRQAQELGGQVRRGERGFLVVKYGTYTKGEDQGAENENENKRGYLKGYTVFNASQIDGIEFPDPPQLSNLSTTEKTDRARQIVEAMPRKPMIHEGSAVPCYRLSTDSVHMPELGYFVSEEAYYSTLFHELGHSTGHSSRLARDSMMKNKGIESFGDTSRKIYAEEELVAEMAASFLNAHAGIIEDELANSAAYLQGWSQALRTKNAQNWIVRAASQGQKAADFILGRSIEPPEPAPGQAKAASFVDRLGFEQAEHSSRDF